MASRTVKVNVYVTVMEEYDEGDDAILDAVTDALNEAGIMAYVELEVTK